jgi:hypothetical protein
MPCQICRARRRRRHLRKNRGPCRTGAMLAVAAFSPRRRCPTGTTPTDTVNPASLVRTLSPDQVEAKVPIDAHSCGALGGPAQAYLYLPAFPIGTVSRFPVTGRAARDPTPRRRPIPMSRPQRGAWYEFAILAAMRMHKKDVTAVQMPLGNRREPALRTSNVNRSISARHDSDTHRDGSAGSQLPDRKHRRR